MARAYYQCSKCFELVLSDGTPRNPLGGCSHVWRKIANEGNKNIYTCKKCDIRAIGVSSTPQATPCPAGGSHVWKRLK